MRRKSRGADRPRAWKVVARLMVAALSQAGLSCAPPVPPERDLLLATASVGGTFYPAGVAMASVLARAGTEEEPLLASAITSSGSAENIRMIELGEAQLGIIQNLFAIQARAGEGLYEGRPVEKLRGVMMLWKNVEQVVARRTRDMEAEPTVTSGLRALAGARLSIGPRWSGAEVSGRALLEKLGFDPDRDFSLAHLGYGPSADALQDRRIDAFFLSAGVPTSAVSQVFAGIGAGAAVMLEFSDAELESLSAGREVWQRHVIPAGTYPGLDRPVATVAQPNVLVTSSEAPEEVIHQVTKALWENLDTLQKQHAVFRELSLERALESMPLPPHPGAERYYREAGL
jgi:TRAP transporter TAXI family solute receptor